LAVYVSATQYKYDVVVNVDEKSPPVNGEMQTNIKVCKVMKMSCSEVPAVLEKYSGGTYEARGVYLTRPIENVRGLSFYWKSTDSNAEAKIKIDYVFLKPYNENGELESEKTQEYRSDIEISSQQTVVLELVKYKYDVEIKINSVTSHILNSKMKIKIKTCSELFGKCEQKTVDFKSDQIISGESYTSESFILNVPIKKVKELSFYWESTDSNAEAKIEIEEVLLEQYDENYELKETNVYHAYNEISSKQTVPLQYFTRERKINYDDDTIY